MLDKTINLKISPSVAVLIVSDIHLQLPITNELSIIQRSLVGRIKELSKHQQAILVLNGDVLELWAQSDQSVEDIIGGFHELTEAILIFAQKPQHKVIFTIGNHDDILASSPTDRAVLQNLWKAQVCIILNLEIGRKIIRIEHGHEHDSYNKSIDSGTTSGKQLVQRTLPLLTKYIPTLITNIGDVVDRSLLISFVLSNLVYKILVPFALPIVIIWSGYLSISRSDYRYIASSLIVLAGLWVMILLADFVLRLLARYVLGGRPRYLRNINKYRKKHKFNILVCGHTHDGMVFKRPGYTYANSGCNDIIATASLGWLGLAKFARYIQMSEIIIDYSKKEPIKYNQQIITLVE